MTTDDSLPYRGEVLDGGQASLCPGVRLRFFRYVRYNAGMRVLLGFLGILLVVGGGLCLGGNALRVRFGGWFPFLVGHATIGLGVLLVVLGLVVALLTLEYFFHGVRQFRSALLPPGIVVSRCPLSMVVLAEMSQDDEEIWYGLRLLDLPRLPSFDHEQGTRVPCVSEFVPGDDPGRWAWFETEPISFGTGDLADLRQCFERLGEESFLRLEACLRRVPLPSNERELVLLDGDWNDVETVEKPASSGS